MKRYIILAALLHIVILSLGQTLKIRDRLTHQPLELATLFSAEPEASALTDAHGKADISGFRGSDTIHIRLIGYEPVLTGYDELSERGFLLYMEPTLLSLDEVVVSATRWRQTASDVPSKISSITPREAALQNPQTAADLLGISGNVYIQKSQQGGGSPMIRGFATNRLLYTIDGVRMNTAIFRGGNIQNVISLDPFAIEHTEVFFGPGSVIYGSDAIGGVMSFRTLTPEMSLNDEPHVTGKAVARYSSANNEKTGHFDVNVGWKKWAFATSVSSFDYDHLRQGRHGPDDYIKPWYVQRQDSMDVVITQEDSLLQIPSAYSQMNLMQKVRFRPTGKWDIQYGFHYSETSPYGRYDRHNRVRNGLPRYAEWNYGPQTWMMNNLSIEHNADNAVFDQLSIRVAQQSFEESRIDRSLNKDTRNIQTEQVEAYSINIDFINPNTAKNTIYYGIEYVINDVNSTGEEKDISTGATEPGPPRYPIATWQSIGAYVSDKYRFSKRFLLQAGLRYNRYILDADFDTTFYPFPFTEANLNSGSLSGSLGVVYQPSDDWVISANLATAFRSPNVDDIGKVFDSEPGAVTVPNPGLEAEYAYNADLGIAKVFDDVIKVDLSGYYTILQNAMVRRDFTLNGQEYIVYQDSLSRVQAMQNAAEAHVYGIQAGIEIKLPAGFGIVSDFNYQVGEEELDDGTTSPSRHAAPMFGTSRLTYSSGDLNLEVYAVYQGERKHEEMPEEEKGKYEIYAADAEGNTYAPSWYTLNFKGMYRLTDLLTVTAGIENITDQRYRPYSSGISGPGRNFVLALSANF